MRRWERRWDRLGGDIRTGRLPRDPSASGETRYVTKHYNDRWVEWILRDDHCGNSVPADADTLARLGLTRKDAA